MRWSRSILLLILLLDVWYRAHTFGPLIREKTGLTLWPQMSGESEPLDCDEAAYAYIGHRILAGDVMYRDLTENKPPLGYWLYALGVAIGGYNELAIRLMAIPFVLATITIVWMIGNRLAGPAAACVAAALYALLSTDPYLFGNGSNMEHFLNLFAVGSLWIMIEGWLRNDRRWFFAAGVALGAATLVKQVAIVHALVYGIALLQRPRLAGSPRSRLAAIAADLVTLASGIAAISALAIAILVVSGAGRSAYEDIILYGRALTTDTLPEPGAPSPLIRWLTGNADPRGELPPPFGRTNYLVWWGQGSWSLWLASIPSLAYLILKRGSSAPRRVTAAWTLSAWLQVALPGLYWQHYYLLPIAGTALAVAVTLSDTLRALILIHRAYEHDRKIIARSWSSAFRLCARACLLGSVAYLLLMAIAITTGDQYKYYLSVPPEQLTQRYKGGQQWVVLRAMGRDIARRTTGWDQPHLYVWGWQSPLLFYSRLDSPTRHLFVDNLLRDQADRDHPLIRPRTEEIFDTLAAHPPELIMSGYPPFKALRTLIESQYRPARIAPGLWLRRDLSTRFDSPSR
jgi:4-amino-4-deoxy-L-arabinose transferase-like glycosyltransferase